MVELNTFVEPEGFWTLETPGRFWKCQEVWYGQNMGHLVLNKHCAHFGCTLSTILTTDRKEQFNRLHCISCSVESLSFVSGIPSRFHQTSIQFLPCSLLNLSVTNTHVSIKDLLNQYFVQLIWSELNFWEWSWRLIFCIFAYTWN